MKDDVEVYEIWRPVKEGGEAYHMEKGNMKLVAFIVDGRVLKLEEGFCLEKRHISKEESIRLL